MLKNPIDRNRYKKYDYKTNHSSFTNRTVSNHRTEQQNPRRKDSVRRAKKQTIENSIEGVDQFCFEDLRIPLGEFHENSLKVTRTLVDQRKKDAKIIKVKNCQLEQQINKQTKEMENLRSALLSIKNTVGDQTEQYIRESEHLKEVNQTLQARFNFQAREMEGLQNEIQNLKTIAENSSGIMPCFSSEIIEESHVSRRAEYAKNYEQAAEVNTKSSCKECYKYRDECEQMREKYEKQLRNLREEKMFYKNKVELMQNLEEEVQNKNECIDFLRSQIDQLEKNSKNLLNVIYSFESKIEKDEPKRHSRAPYHIKSKPDQIFTSFNEFKY